MCEIHTLKYMYRGGLKRNVLNVLQLSAYGGREMS